MRTCGIDLGTTNSCIYMVDKDDYRLISDDQGHHTFPSVVFVSRDGKESVGYPARNRIGERPGPVAAVKRKMGSTETVLLGGEERTPVDVSAMILSFLKGLAEAQSGQPVDRAVITVPAYFSHIQRHQTDEAGQRAGFREVITLLEPVAAALAYSVTHGQDHLRVFVYDLGGGTFDATVLEKSSDSGLTVLSFGGDAFLGGDNIDSRLARLILERLKKQGYRLDLDLDDPEDASRFQQLKFYAEYAKIELTDHEAVAVVRQGLFEDHDGEIVDLDLTVTREELEECSEDLIQRSIDASLQTLDKKQIALESLDEVIMVGGMSRMPLVQRKLADAFKRDPQVVDPDLIVARGAAIKAAEIFVEQEVAESGFVLELHYDRRTSRDRVQISGAFDRVVTDHVIYLLSDTDERSHSLDGVDHFSFDQVVLQPGVDNVFTLSIEDLAENPVIEREVVITHDLETNPILTSPSSVVTKPLGLRLVDGVAELFPENTPLPYKTTHTVETADQSGQIIIPIWEGNHEVARLEIHDIPCDLKVGTPVVIEVQVEMDYQIEAKANVPDISRSADIRFHIEPIDTAAMTPEGVRQRLTVLEAESREAMANCPSAEAVERFQLLYQSVQDQIDMELSELEPQRARLHEKLGELAALIDTLPSPQKDVQLEPSFSEFSQELTELLTQAMQNNHPNLSKARPQAEALRTRARTAWEAKDAVTWQWVNDQVKAIASLLEPEVDFMERAQGMAAWLAANQVAELRQAAGGRHTAAIQKIEEDAKTIFVHVQVGGLDPQNAIQQLVSLYREEVLPLRAQLGLDATGEPQDRIPSDFEGFVRSRS